MTLLAKLADHFRANPNIWMDGKALEFAGRYAWRSRVSDCRTQLGMTIENRVRTVAFQGEITPGRSRHFTISEYRFVPTSTMVEMGESPMGETFRCTCAEMTDPPCGWCDGPDRG